MRVERLLLLACFVVLSLILAEAQQGTALHEGAAERVAKLPSEVFPPIQQAYYASVNRVATVERAAEEVAPSSSAGSSSASSRVTSMPESRSPATSASAGSQPTSGSSGVYTTLPRRKFYDANSYNSALVKLKADLLSAIPPDDKPLRAYVEAKFPQPLVPLDNKYIRESEVEFTNGTVNGLMDHLRLMKSFLMDLNVKTSPSIAKFQLVPKIGDERTLTTDGIISNLYRGMYEYTVTKRGYRKVHDTINLVEQSGDTVECKLLPDSQPEVGYCTLK